MKSHLGLGRILLSVGFEPQPRVPKSGAQKHAWMLSFVERCVTL